MSNPLKGKVWQNKVGLWILGDNLASLFRDKGRWVGKVAPSSEFHIGPFVSFQAAMIACETYIRDWQRDAKANKV